MTHHKVGLLTLNLHSYLVVCCSFLVVHLLPGEDETLLWGRDTFLLLDTLLDPLNLVSGLDVDLDFLTGECLDLDQHRV